MLHAYPTSLADDLARHTARVDNGLRIHECMALVLRIGEKQILTKSLEAIAARTALIPDIKSTCMETFGAVAESYGESELPAEPGAPGQPAEVVEASADGGGDGNGGVLD